MALNRYPVPSSEALRARLRDVMDVPAGMDVLLGNGSDEIISMLSLAAARPGAKVLAPVPGFVMYAMSAQFAGLAFVGVPLRADFTLDRAAMLAAMAEHKPAIIYLAYPNNPTGNLFDAADMEAIVRAAQGEVCHSLVVVDEAYQPFAQESWMPRADRIRQPAWSCARCRSWAWPGSASATWPARPSGWRSWTRCARRTTSTC